MTARLPILIRSLLVAAAVCVVAAFALAVLSTPATRLERVVATIDTAALPHLQDWVRATWGDWAWQNICVAILVRPAWLLPLCVSIVLTGLAISLKTVHGRSESKSAER